MKKFLVVSVALLFAATAFAAGPTAKVTGGTLAGTADDGVQIFKGIPYAAPPVGKLRWAPPADVVPWTGTRDATKFSADCMQAPYDKSSVYYRPLEAVSEDCL